MTTVVMSQSRSRTAHDVLAPGVGLLVGAVTSVAQGLLSYPVGALANAASPWLMAPFLIGSAARNRRSAASLGVLSCMAQVVGYYLTSAVRGFGINPTWVAVWLIAAVVGGVVFGSAGASWQRGDGWERGLGAGLLIAVWACEAVRYVVDLDYVGEAVIFATIAVGLWVLLGFHGRQHLRILGWLPVAAGLGVAGELVMLSVL
jgi:hypothetical protein